MHKLQRTGLSRLWSSVVVVGVIGCVDVDVEPPPPVEAREPLAVEIDVTWVRGEGARPGQAVRAGVRTDIQLLADDVRDFDRACTLCGTSGGSGLFNEGITFIAGNVAEDTALIDLETITSWALARDAARVVGTLASEEVRIGARWLLPETAAAVDDGAAQAGDRVVDTVEAGVWVAAAVEVIADEATTAEVSRLLRAGGDDRDAAIGRVLTAAGGTFRVAVASTIKPEVLAAVDASGCTVSTFRGCAELANAWGALIIPVIGDDDFADVIAGDHDFWQPMRFSTAAFTAPDEP